MLFSLDCNVQLMEKSDCEGPRPRCEFVGNDAKLICSLSKKVIYFSPLKNWIKILKPLVESINPDLLVTFLYNYLRRFVNQTVHKIIFFVYLNLLIPGSIFLLTISL